MAQLTKRLGTAVDRDRCFLTHAATCVSRQRSIHSLQAAFFHEKLKLLSSKSIAPAEFAITGVLVHSLFCYWFSRLLVGSSHCQTAHGRQATIFLLRTSKPLAKSTPYGYTVLSSLPSVVSGQLWSVCTRSLRSHGAASVYDD